jgi:predicted Zn-ribbon and HTH transcriptional regulator
VNLTILERLTRSKLLVSDLNRSKTTFCGIGIRELRLLLSQLSNSGDKVAEILKLALEIEETNIMAKSDFDYLKDRIYHRKEILLEELCQLCQDCGFNFGSQKSDRKGVRGILFFDLPFGQVSWHTNLNPKKFPAYNKPWDGLENSTLDKLEKFINEKYFQNGLAKIPAPYKAYLQD